MYSRRRMKVPLFDLVSSLSEVADMVDPALNDHHKRVGYIAFAVGREMGLGPAECDDLLLAGMLHDIGALSLAEKTRMLRFEVTEPHRHAELGGLLLKPFAPLAGIGDLIFHHHVPWRCGAGAPGGEAVPIGSHVLHLADRVAIQAKRSGDLAGLARKVTRKIETESGGLFMPEAVEAFRSLARKESFWLDVTGNSLGRQLRQSVRLQDAELDLAGISSLAQVFSRVIDFRSRFTASHSNGVATVAEALAHLIGYSEHERAMMRIAGCLHDLGKLAVPVEFVEKAAPLTKREQGVVRSHPFHTYRALERIGDFSTIARWSAFHHECPNGEGYPFRVGDDELPLGSRIVAVADVFSALTEDRPYRPGLAGDETVALLRQMARASLLDGKVTALLIRNFAEVSALHESSRSSALSAYEDLHTLRERGADRTTALRDGRPS